jgi:lysophospholipase L1-like esterase
LFYKVITAVSAAVLVLVVFELGIRLFIPSYIYEHYDPADDWQPDSSTGWVNRPDIDRRFVTLTGEEARFRTNQDGINSATAKREKKSGTIRIMIFGDSTTVGRGVPQDKTVNKDLESILRSRGIDVEVLNAGVQGYGTDQVFLRMQQLIPLYHPDIVFYCLCTNDFGTNKQREAHRLPKPMFVIDDKDRLVLIPPDMRGAEVTRCEISGGLRGRIQYSALYRYLRPGILKLREYFSSWKPNDSLVFQHAYWYDPASLNTVDWRLFEALLKAMKSYASENNSKFIFYDHPGLIEVWEPIIKYTEKLHGLKPENYDRYAIERKLIEAGKECSVSFIPTIDYFLANSKRGPFHLIPYDAHCNAAGYQVTAEAIADYMLRSGYLK